MTTRFAGRLLAPVLFAWMALLSSAQADDSAPKQTVTASDMDRAFRKAPVQIATPDARLHRFDMWIADDDQRRMRGLMFIRQLRPNDGMLFIYPQAHPVAMWMKNTYVSLDIVFVAADGKVIRVAENTEPLSLATIESGAPALGVVELPAGTAKRLHIGPGAQVIHPAFAPSKP